MHHILIVVNGNVVNMNFVTDAKLNREVTTKDATKMKRIIPHLKGVKYEKV